MFKFPQSRTDLKEQSETDCTKRASQTSIAHECREADWRRLAESKEATKFQQVQCSKQQAQKVPGTVHLLLVEGMQMPQIQPALRKRDRERDGESSRRMTFWIILVDVRWCEMIWAQSRGAGHRIRTIKRMKTSRPMSYKSLHESRMFGISIPYIPCLAMPCLRVQECQRNQAMPQLTLENCTSVGDIRSFSPVQLLDSTYIRLTRLRTEFKPGLCGSCLAANGSTSCQSLESTVTALLWVGHLKRCLKTSQHPKAKKTVCPLNL